MFAGVLQAGEIAVLIDQSSQGVLKWPKRAPRLDQRWGQRWEAVDVCLCPWPLTCVCLPLCTQEEEAIGVRPML